MKGKTVLITGASAGLGYETALDMARRGAKVIIGNRKTEGLKEKIEVTVPGSQVDVFKLDLSLKESVLDFCAKVKAGHDKIHVFINNAALVANPEFADEPYKKRMSADGKHEITMATNYIGHCILNEELLDLLAKGGQDGDYARIVVVSSLAFMLASQMQKVEKFDLDARHSKYDTATQYAYSKHAQLFYTRIMARRFKKEGINAIICATCPGLVDTGIVHGLVWWVKIGFQTALFFLGKSPKQGAQCPIWMATETVPKNEINESFYFDASTFNWLLKIKAPEERLDEFWAHTQQLMKE